MVAERRVERGELGDSHGDRLRLGRFERDSFAGDVNVWHIVMDVRDSIRMRRQLSEQDSWCISSDRGRRGGDVDSCLQLRWCRGVGYGAELCCERWRLCDSDWAELWRQ